jgi:hypothetical protein
MTNQLAIPPPFGTAVASRPPRKLTLSVDSSKRLDHFAAKLLVCHPGIYLLVKREAFHDPANILREPTDVAVEVRN